MEGSNQSLLRFLAATVEVVFLSGRGFYLTHDYE